MAVDMEAGNADTESKYRVRVFAQATVYSRRAIPKREMQKTEAGLIVEAFNHYDEFDCQQIAVSYPALYIKESHLDKLLDSLKEGIKKTLRDKGLVI